MKSQSFSFRSQVLSAALTGVVLLSTMPGFADEMAQKTSYTAPSVVAKSDLSAVQITSNAALEQKADLLMAHREYVSAIHVYEAVISPDAEVLNKTGIAYEKMRLYEQAKVDFSQAIALNPKLSGPSNNLGTVFYVQGDYHRAEKFYKKALKLEPRNASVYNNLGTLYFTKRKVHKGVEAYQQALSLDPEIFQRSAANGIQTDGSKESVAIINFYLAETCAEAGKNAAAMLYLRRAINAGFHDEAKLREDRHFAGMRELPEFRSLFVAEAVK